MIRIVTFTTLYPNAAQPAERPSLAAVAATRRYAENFSWDETTQGQIRLFEAVLACPPS